MTLIIQKPTGAKLVMRQQYVPLDANYSSVSLLLHGDGPNGSTVFTDNSPAPKTVTAAGNAQISTAQSKFGGASIAFDGSGDYLGVSGSSLDFSGDYTIEGWVYRTTNASGYFFDTRLNGNGTNPLVILESGTLDFYVDASLRISISISSLIQTWMHIALVRSSGVYSLYLNGTASATTYSSSSSLQLSLTVGARGSRNSSFLNGYIDDLRITGIARYAANFTPPTEPFPDRTDG
jgi:hypothetical protein